MKAVVVESPGVVSLVDRELPRPNAGEVLVRVAYANVCHTDHFIVGGQHPTARLPIVPGHEISGTIESVGSNVDRSRVGQRVTIDTQLGCGSCESCLSDAVGWCPSQRELGSSVDGGWQEAIAVPASAAVPIPTHLSLLEASLTEPSANAYAATEAAEIRPADTVLVIGPGPIGLLVLQHAMLQNPRAVMVAGLPGDEVRLGFASHFGASATFAQAPADAAGAVLAATAGHGADVVIQCAGSVAASALALAVLADRGRLVIEGFAASVESVQLVPDQVVVREQRIRGVRGWNHSQFASTLSLHGSGRIQLRPLVTDCLPLDSYEAALERSLDYASGVIKVCFAVQPEGQSFA